MTLRWRGALILMSSGLLVWLVYFVVVYLVVDLGCELRASGALRFDAQVLRRFALAATLATVALIALLGLYGWRLFGRERAERDAPLHSQVAEFSGTLTALVAGLAIVATVWTGLPALLVPACQ